MNYLLDVNALVAWGWADHADHDRVDTWVANLLEDAESLLLTSAIPELGFARVSMQRGAGQLSLDLVSKVLVGMIETIGKQHRFLPDDQHSKTWPNWCQGAGRTTDAHLLQLATTHGALLATLDENIPGAFLIPRLS